MFSKLEQAEVECQQARMRSSHLLVGMGLTGALRPFNPDLVSVRWPLNMQEPTMV